MTPEEKSAIAVAFDAFDPVVVNLGAYHGEDDAEFQSLVFPGRELLHIMVEPDPMNCRRIRRDFRLSKMRRLIPGAVASKSGRRAFYRSFDRKDGSAGSGSLLEPVGHLKEFPDVDFPIIQEVYCYTLDQLFEFCELSKIDLLWVDVQGAESEVIEGGRDALARTRYLFLEAEKQELYRGQVLREGLLAMLPGWKLIADFDYNVLLKNEAYQ